MNPLFVLFSFCSPAMQFKKKPSIGQKTTDCHFNPKSLNEFTKKKGNRVFLLTQKLIFLSRKKVCAINIGGWYVSLINLKNICKANFKSDSGNLRVSKLLNCVINRAIFKDFKSTLATFRQQKFMTISNRGVLEALPHNINFVIYITIFLLCNACATYKVQYKDETRSEEKASTKTVAHTFYLAGGIGNSDENSDKQVLNLLENHLAEATESSTLLFMGDNISNEPDNWGKDKQILDRQLSLVENFKGSTIFIPGNNEWKSFNTKKIGKTEEYLDNLEEEYITYYPKNVCPIEHRGDQR